MTQLTVEANEKKCQAVGCAAGLERSSEKHLQKEWNRFQIIDVR